MTSPPETTGFLFRDSGTIFVERTPKSAVFTIEYLNKNLQSFKQRLSTDNHLTIEIVENNLKDFEHDLLQLQNNEA